VEVLGTVDVLLVPVGGGNGLNAAQAAEIISLIQPSIVVPMHYKTHNNKLKLDPLSRFLKEMGLGKVPPEQSLKVTKSSLPEETQVVVLEPKGG
jgi:L-ascorbate metabolism protein UlaG (beta-lactamase superfamily)